MPCCSPGTAASSGADGRTGAASRTSARTDSRGAPAHHPMAAREVRDFLFEEGVLSRPGVDKDERWFTAADVIHSQTKAVPVEQSHGASLHGAALTPRAMWDP